MGFLGKLQMKHSEEAYQSPFEKKVGEEDETVVPSSPNNGLETNTYGQSLELAGHTGRANFPGHQAATNHKGVQFHALRILLELATPQHTQKVCHQLRAAAAATATATGDCRQLREALLTGEDRADPAAFNLLHVACATNQAEAVEVIIELAAEADASAGDTASKSSKEYCQQGQRNDESLLEWLVLAHMSPYTCEDANTENCEGLYGNDSFTPLELACRRDTDGAAAGALLRGAWEAAGAPLLRRALAPFPEAPPRALVLAAEGGAARAGRRVAAAAWGLGGRTQEAIHAALGVRALGGHGAAAARPAGPRWPLRAAYDAGRPDLFLHGLDEEPPEEVPPACASAIRLAVLHHDSAARTPKIGDVAFQHALRHIRDLRRPLAAAAFPAARAAELAAAIRHRAGLRKRMADDLKRLEGKIVQILQLALDIPEMDDPEAFLAALECPAPEHLLQWGPVAALLVRGVSEVLALPQVQGAVDELMGVRPRRAPRRWAAQDWRRRPALHVSAELIMHLLYLVLIYEVVWEQDQELGDTERSWFFSSPRIVWHWREWLLVVQSVGYLWVERLQLVRLGFEVYNHSKWNYLDLVIQGLVLLWTTTGITDILALNLFLLPLRLLYYFTLFETTGIYVTVLLKMLVDTGMFLGFYSVLLLGYGGMCTLMLGTRGYDGFLGWGQSVLTLFRAGLGDFDYGAFQDEDSGNYDAGAVVLLTIFVGLAAIMAMNLLIAVLTITFEELHATRYPAWCLIFCNLVRDAQVPQDWPGNLGMPGPLALFSSICQAIGGRSLPPSCSASGHPHRRQLLWQWQQRWCQMRVYLAASLVLAIDLAVHLIVGLPLTAACLLPSIFKETTDFVFRGGSLLPSAEILQLKGMLVYVSFMVFSFCIVYPCRIILYFTFCIPAETIRVFLGSLPGISIHTTKNVAMDGVASQLTMQQHKSASRNCLLRLVEETSSVKKQSVFKKTRRRQSYSIVSNTTDETGFRRLSFKSFLGQLAGTSPQPLHSSQPGEWAKSSRLNSNSETLVVQVGQGGGVEVWKKPAWLAPMQAAILAAEPVARGKEFQQLLQQGRMAQEALNCLSRRITTQLCGERARKDLAAEVWTAVTKPVHTAHVEGGCTSGRAAVTSSENAAGEEEERRVVGVNRATDQGWRQEAGNGLTTHPDDKEKILLGNQGGAPIQSEEEITKEQRGGYTYPSAFLQAQRAPFLTFPQPKGDQNPRACLNCKTIIAACHCNKKEKNSRAPSSSYLAFLQSGDSYGSDSGNFNDDVMNNNAGEGVFEEVGHHEQEEDSDWGDIFLDCTMSQQDDGGGD